MNVKTITMTWICPKCGKVQTTTIGAAKAVIEDVEFGCNACEFTNSIRIKPSPTVKLVPPNNPKE